MILKIWTTDYLWDPPKSIPDTYDMLWLHGVEVYWAGCRRGDALLVARLVRLVAVAV